MLKSKWSASSNLLHRLFARHPYLTRRPPLLRCSSTTPRAGSSVEWEGEPSIPTWRQPVSAPPLNRRKFQPQTSGRTSNTATHRRRHLNQLNRNSQEDPFPTASVRCRQRTERWSGQGNFRHKNEKKPTNCRSWRGPQGNERKQNEAQDWFNRDSGDRWHSCAGKQRWHFVLATRGAADYARSSLLRLRFFRRILLA